MLDYNIGAYGLYNGSVYHCLAPKIEKVVDSVGAGDAFVAAAIYCEARHMPFEELLLRSCFLASMKCGGKLENETSLEVMNSNACLLHVKNNYVSKTLST